MSFPLINTRSKHSINNFRNIFYFWYYTTNLLILHTINFKEKKGGKKENLLIVFCFIPLCIYDYDVLVMSQFFSGCPTVFNNWPVTLFLLWFVEQLRKVLDEVYCRGKLVGTYWFCH
ncbi:hypothetical protein CsSME_00039082 [Camellia sinensis var. sinensis]